MSDTTYHSWSKNTIRRWQKKLPFPYILKTIPLTNYWFVDGFCGYYVVGGYSPREAVREVIEKIRRIRK